jgi:RND family efflux transporter MFP subunit
MKKFLLHFVLPVLIIAGGVATARYLKSQAKSAKQRPPEKTAPVVETITATVSEVNTRIVASGMTMPAKRVTLTPEVTGRILKISKALVPGNRVKKGQILARLDNRDYALAIAQEVSRVEQAELALQQEVERKVIAEKELKLLGKDKNTTVSTLATRTPQLNVARQNTQAAESGLAKAKLNLSRTVLRAPFNALVMEKNVDKGQLVGPSTSVATLIGTDELWVDVSVNVEQLPRIQIPGVNSEAGSRAIVVHQIGPNTRVEREGRVLQLQGELDPQNRTAQLLVSIPKPFDGPGLPLLSGAFVTVEIDGQAVHEGFSLPREALRDGHFVWAVDKGDRLRKRQVEVVWRDRERVVVTTGVAEGETIVTSPLVDPIDGMAVKRVDKEKPATAKAE